MGKKIVEVTMPRTAYLEIEGGMLSEANKCFPGPARTCKEEASLESVTDEFLKVPNDEYSLEGPATAAGRYSLLRPLC